MALENTDEYQKWLTKVQQNSYSLEFVPEALKTETICLLAVQKNGLALEYVPDALKTEALCLTAVQQYAYALEFVPDALKTEALCLIAAQKKGNTLEFVIQPNDHLATHPEQLAIWNRILMQVDETDSGSKKHLQAQLISPLLAQANAAQKFSASVLDEIAILIEHFDRLKIKSDQIKELYCEKQAFQKPQSKHGLSASSEHTL